MRVMLPSGLRTVERGSKTGRRAPLALKVPEKSPLRCASVGSVWNSVALELFPSGGTMTLLVAS